jgi:uncharacterized membrane protein
MVNETPGPEERPVMEERPVLGGEVTENDRLMAALSYPIPVVALVILLSETNRARPFQKFHGVQALAFWVVLTVVGIVLSVVTLGVGTLCFPILWLVSLWPAYEAYQGKYLELPVITNFIRNQGWV